MQEKEIKKTKKQGREQNLLLSLTQNQLNTPLNFFFGIACSMCFILFSYFCLVVVFVCLLVFDCFGEQKRVFVF